MSAKIRMRVITFIVWPLLVLAGCVSATHIVHTADMLGLHDWQRFTTPALIDIVAVVGKLSMYAEFARSFRKSGMRLLMIAGTISLACNVYAGANLGQRAFGVLVVGVFMLLEHHADKGGQRAVETAPPVRKLSPEVAAEAARKRAATIARKKEEAAAAAIDAHKAEAAATRVATRRANARTNTDQVAPAGEYELVK